MGPFHFYLVALTYPLLLSLRYSFFWAVAPILVSKFLKGLAFP